MAKILLIDDDPKMRSMIIRMLAPAHEVIEATNGRQGLDLLASTAPALVITDIMMPEMDGIETIRNIRKTSPQVPVIAISGSNPADDQPDFLKFARDFGAVSILSKPFRAAELTEAVAKALGKAG